MDARDRADELAGTIAAHIESFRPGEAVTAALDAVATGAIDIRSMYARVLSRLLVRIGERWQSGTETVWREHYASAVVRTIVDALYPTVTRLAASRERLGRSVVLACPPQEPHDLGLRMLSDTFELAGWTSYFLGADVPQREIVAAARELRPEMLVLYAATHFNRVELREVVDRIRPELPGVDVRVTGYVFHREHDGWLDDELLDPHTFFGKAE